MKTEKLVDQLELYSNAIVGFTVAQCVGFSVTFGTSADFGCEITRFRWLSAGLALHFLVATLLAAWAIAYLRERISALSGDNITTVRAVYRAKTAACVLFSIIPIGLLLAFGVFGDPTEGRCAKALKTAIDALLQSAA